MTCIFAELREEERGRREKLIRRGRLPSALSIINQSQAIEKNNDNGETTSSRRAAWRCRGTHEHLYRVHLCGRLI